MSSPARLPPGIETSAATPECVVQKIKVEGASILRRVCRDCWWLSAVIAIVLITQHMPVDVAPAWSNLAVLLTLTAILGVAIAGWTVVIGRGLRHLPGLALALAVTVPVVTTLSARHDARLMLSHAFGIDPDVFPITLDVLTAVHTLWMIFVVVALLLLGLFFVTLILQFCDGSWRRTLTTALPLSIPLAAVMAAPMAGGFTLHTHVAELARAFDSFPTSRCTFVDQPVMPDRITFLSDNQVLAWLPDLTRPIVLSCQLGS